MDNSMQSKSFSSRTIDSSGDCMAYICANCNEETELRAKDTVKCTSCGHPGVLYKKRTKRRNKI
ncbi:hypothetical protein HZS_6381 [Henneguya salminicola]|nr:hypothetical protein HZS_6381 [Henneguya salminicola]